MYWLLIDMGPTNYEGYTISGVWWPHRVYVFPDEVAREVFMEAYGDEEGHETRKWCRIDPTDLFYQGVE